MQYSISLFILFFSSVYVLFLSFLVHSNTELQRAVVLLLIILLISIICFRSSPKTWRKFERKWGKRVFLLWGTIFSQMIVLATGGLQSPFLILLYFFMVTISFIFSFSLALIFLGISLVVIFINISFSQNITIYFVHDPTVIILHIVSLLAIIPLAFLVSRQYQIRNILFSSLHIQVKTDEKIMKFLKELIIITDSTFTILSVNDAVEQSLQKSRSELLGQPIFNVLALRDKNGNVATKETFFLHGDSTKHPKNNRTIYDLLFTTFSQKEVTVTVNIIKGVANIPDQIIFILSFLHTAEAPVNTVTSSLEKTRAKYEALSEHMLQALRKKNITPLLTQAVIMREIERDLYSVNLFQQYPNAGIISAIDSAKLIKQTAEEEREFAKAFAINIDFSIENFGEKDIAPLTVKNYPVTPDQLTGPFFTIKTDVRRFEFLIKKLFDIAVLLSSEQKNAHLSIIVNRGVYEEVVLTITTPCEKLNSNELSDLFLPYYGRLYTVAHLQESSGFEGYLVKSVCNMLSYKLDTSYSEKPYPGITFILHINKSYKGNKTI